jgi:hypothetical protein
MNEINTISSKKGPTGYASKTIMLMLKNREYDQSNLGISTSK